MKPIEVEGKAAYRWEVGAASYIAAPEMGARLMQWDIALAGRAPRNVIYWPGEADMENIASVRGGNPILFPFSARSYHHGMENHWCDPEGTVRPMPRHGFARNGQFLIENMDESGFLARLVPTGRDNNAYPFNYTFHVEYLFDELSFTVTFLLCNRDDKPIPWSAGHHFYFSLPWHAQTLREEYVLEIPNRKAFYHAPDGKLVAAEICRDSHPDFSDPRLVDRIHTHLKRNEVRFGLKNNEEHVCLTIGQTMIPSTYTTIVTWTEDEDAPFYCVEPWMGPPNSPEHGKGLHYVQPGQTGEFRVEVSLL